MISKSLQKTYFYNPLNNRDDSATKGIDSNFNTIC